MMIPENNITINVRPTFEDFLHANRLYRASRAKNYIDPFSIGIMTALVFGCVLLLLINRPEMFPIANSGTKVLLMSLFLIGLALIFDLPATIGLRLVFRENRQPAQVIFDKVGMTVKRQKESPKYEWSFYKEGVEGRSVFILIYGNGLYYVIPKTSFQDEKEIDRFRTMLKSNLAIFKQKLKIPMDF